MWTPATRRQHNRESLRYETDLTDREWNLIAPMMPAAAKTGRPRGWPLREIMNAIFYVMRGGIGWRLLPSDFPPRSTVFRWFCRFRDECLFEKINHRLLMLDRERCGREASPTASIIDSQSMKTCESGGPCGYDAGKKIKGRKRHALVDTNGRALVLFPHPASIQDRDGAGPVLQASRRPFPSSARSSPMPPIRDRASPKPPPSPSRSSSGSPIRSTSRSSRDDGWSNASSPGSVATVGFGRTPKPQSDPPPHSSTPQQS